MSCKIYVMPPRGTWLKETKGKLVVNCTSHGNTEAERGLSPFYLGPVPLYSKYTSHNMENGWQYSKVYYEHAKNGKPTSQYWEWARTGWAAHRANRYPMGKGRKPEFSWWDGRSMDYVQARKKIYVPTYAKAVMKTQSWKWLKSLYQEARELYIVDFDAYDHRAEGLKLTDVLNNPKKKMGHGFVLAMLLSHDKALDLTGLHL